MTASILRQESCSELTELLALLTHSGGEALGSLVGRELTVAPVETAVMESQRLLGALKGAYVVGRARLEKDFEGRSVWVLLDIRDAIAMSGMLMMTPDEVIQQRCTKGVLEGEDAEAFGELGNVMFSGIATALRDKIADIGLGYETQGQIRSGVDGDGLLASGTMVVHTFTLQVGDFEKTVAHLVTDVATAEAWNRAPLETTDGTVLRADAAAAQGAKGDEEGFEGIPAAPIRGVLAAFVTLPEVYRTLRQTCRRIGLDLQRHGKGEIPNPAAHRDQIVLLDIPAGEARQFDWCKRIKDFSAGTKVVLLIHHPSRTRVTQAFLSKADAILGLPCDEPQLSQKLTSVLESAPAAPEQH